jgi:hypothetical protein
MSMRLLGDPFKLIWSDAISRRLLITLTCANLIAVGAALSNRKSPRDAIIEMEEREKREKGEGGSTFIVFKGERIEIKGADME